jgi:hypothetical protein
MSVIPRLPENTKPVLWSFVIGGIVTMFLGLTFLAGCLKAWQNKEPLNSQ